MHSSPIPCVQILISSPQENVKAEEIEDLLKKHSTPLFGELNGDTFQTYVSSGRGLIWILLKHDGDDFKAVVDKERATYVALAKRVAEKRDASRSASGYDIYHKDFSMAMKHAYDFAKKKGLIVKDSEIDDKVASGPRKPSNGKTNSYILKTNNPRRNLHVQVYNTGRSYELNMYIQ